MSISSDSYAPLCSSQYMHGTLRHFSLEQASKWFEEIKAVDAIVSPIIEANYDRIEANDTRIPTDLIEELSGRLREAGVETDYDLANVEVFHGYIYYVSPDNGLKIVETRNDDLNYGIAKAMLQGLPHRHFESDSFNYILGGEGVFTGDPLEKGAFPNYYHGTKLEKGREIEIPIGMTHGHLVRKGSVLWFLAVQECSFAPDKGCAGDFHKLPAYDSTIFGPGYN